MWVKNLDDCKLFLLTEPVCCFNGNSFAITVQQQIIVMKAFYKKIPFLIS